MTASSSTQAAHSDAQWDAWGTALEQFAAATGLTVSAFDIRGERRLGPYCSSRFAELLCPSGVWTDAGPGTSLERELVMKCLASRLNVADNFCGELKVFATPLTLFDAPWGAVVYGWTFETFATGLGCDRIAAAVGLPGAKLWKEARLELPVPANRMQTYGALLGTMISFNMRQLEALERLHELARMREVLLASVSHELRSPLSAISLRLDLLLRGALDKPEVLRAALTRMKEQVLMESRLIEDLIDAARTRTGQLTMESELISLARVLQDAVAAVQPQAETKEVSLDLRGLETGEDALIRADAQRLQQLFWNLLFNAVKFTPPGGRVTVQLTRKTDSHVIEVRDNGQGIEPGALPLIFDAFNKRQKDNSAGLGLGLFIAKHIAERHGGSISVSSAGRNLGTTFTVTLPVTNDLQSG